MKMLFLSLALAAGLFVGLEQSTGEQQIKENVAEAFQVTESDVTLQSPNIIDVSLVNGSTTTGTAKFLDCGEMCTQVKVTFPSTTLNFIVEDEISGF